MHWPIWPANNYRQIWSIPWPGIIGEMEIELRDQPKTETSRRRKGWKMTKIEQLNMSKENLKLLIAWNGSIRSHWHLRFTTTGLRPTTHGRTGREAFWKWSKNKLYQCIDIQRRLKKLQEMMNSIRKQKTSKVMGLIVEVKQKTMGSGWIKIPEN